MAREGLTCGAETSCGGWGRGERKEWMDTTDGEKKNKEEKS